MAYPKSVKKFLNDLIEECQNNNVTLKLEYKKNIALYNTKFDGYFAASNPLVLAVATKKDLDKWLEVLVHESCHLDQHLEETFSIEIDNFKILNDWISGTPQKKTKVIQAVNTIKKYELDCEKRGVEKIIKYNLPIDTELYIKKSNIYIFYYNWVLENRSFGKGKIYNNEILELINSTFYKSYSKTPVFLQNHFNEVLKK